MPSRASNRLRRSAVVDLGSNSVRLVVFEGDGRVPVAIFNEKAVLRLGRGLQTTGLLNEDGVTQALTVMARYNAIARAMGADPFEVLATAAVRDASNGAAFVAGLQDRMPGVPILILPGEREAALSAAGLLCGIPEADGILADVGGGSLEVVELSAGRRGRAQTLPLGIIRLTDRAAGDPLRARALAEADLGTVPWLIEGTGRDLYLVGGAWRALARVHIAQTGYPLNIVHHYTIAREEARALTGALATASRKTLEKMPRAPRRRIDDLAFAAVVLRRVLRATGARRVVFSANGLREGWYMQRLSAAQAALDPMLAAAQDYARQSGRDLTLPPRLIEWTQPLLTHEGNESRRLREAACWLSDIGSRDHPEYRAEQSYFHVLHQPGVTLDHYARAYLALVTALRYEAEPEAPFLSAAHSLLTPESVRRATVLGCALRLAYTLSAGTPDLLAGTRLLVGDMLTLQLVSNGGVFAGDSVIRRLDRLGAAAGLAARTEIAAA